MANHDGGRHSVCVPATSILFILATPDGRESTTALGRILDDLERRDDVRVSVWYLRVDDNEEPRPGSRVVDELRTWAPVHALERSGLEMIAARVRGLLLRGWFLKVRPDVVVLDDGLGERLLGSTSRRPVRVVRLNPEPPTFLHFEPTPLDHGDVTIVPPSSTRRPTVGRVIDDTLALDLADMRRLGTDDARRATRQLHALPVDVPLVVGWGDDGWLDGPDLFVRALWALEHRHGVIAHGVWVGLGVDPHEVERLRMEADRCGVGDRFHQRPTITPALKVCGDVVFLPYRSPGDRLDLLCCVAGGSALVTFPVTDVEADAVAIVPHLDVERAADEIVAFLEGDRATRWRDSLRLVDAGGFTEYFLEVVRSIA